MHRRPLIDLLARYAARWPEERRVVHRFRAFVGRHSDCLLRTCAPGHITASAWILSADGARCLLTHHRKLDRWLQLGGHVDGEEHVQKAALREAREESGMERFTLVPRHGGVLPLDLDVHEIPAHGGEPAHLHYDVRLLLVAESGQRLAVSDESHDVRWFTATELLATCDEESVLRMHRKSRDAAWGCEPGSPGSSAGTSGMLPPPAAPQ